MLAFYWEQVFYVRFDWSPLVIIGCAAIAILVIQIGMYLLFIIDAHISVS